MINWYKEKNGTTAKKYNKMPTGYILALKRKKKEKPYNNPLALYRNGTNERLVWVKEQTKGMHVFFSSYFESGIDKKTKLTSRPHTLTHLNEKHLQEAAESGHQKEELS